MINFLGLLYKVGCFVLATILLCRCNNYFPKPKAMLRLDYPSAKYKPIGGDCPYDFLISEIGEVTREGCDYQIHYKSMKATIYINYRKVQQNLRALLQDAQKLTYEHVIKADNISEKIYKNHKNKVYTTLYNVMGNAASQVQFYATDSIKNFILGSLYFYAQPNYDSIYPAVKYINKDIYKMIESLKWKD